jgi:hypothetical protein
MSRANICASAARYVGRRLKPDGMRTRAIVGAFLLAAGLVIWLSMSSCKTEERTGGSTGNTKHNVVIQEGGLGILIPGTEISKADAEAMNNILKKYEKDVYKLKTYQNASLIKTEGKLKDLVLDRELMSTMAANVKKAGFTQFAVQLGIGTNPQLVTLGPAATPVSSTNAQRKSTGPSPTPSVGYAQTNLEKESRELVKELRPILQKYRTK